MEEVVVAQRPHSNQLLPSGHGPSLRASPESSATPSFHFGLPSLPDPASTSSDGWGSGSELLLWHLERGAAPVLSPTSSSDEEHSPSEADGNSLCDRKPNGSPQHHQWTLHPNPTSHSKEEQRKSYGSPPGDPEDLWRTERGQRVCWDRAGGMWRTDSQESMGSGSSPSITERVEINRDIVKEMLSRSPSGSAPLRRDTVDPWRSRGSIQSNDSDRDSGISMPGSEQRVFVSPEEFPLSVCHDKARRLLERARMKARCFPLKADHNLLHLHREPAEVVSIRGPGPLQQTTVRRTGRASTPSEHHSNSPRGDSAWVPPRRQPGPSPSRVRFEDETEKEAEFRYLERSKQRRGGSGLRAQGPLISKLSLSALVNARRGVESPDRANGLLQEAGCIPDRRGSQEMQSSTLAAQEASSRSLRDTLICSHPQHPHIFPVLPENEEHATIPYWVAPNSPCITLRTEHIKETYIGGVTPNNALPMTLGSGGTSDRVKSEHGCVSTMQVMRRTNQRELTVVNGHLKLLPPDFAQITPTIELPPNPYALDQRTTPTQTQKQNSIHSMSEGLNQSVSVTFNNGFVPTPPSLTTQSRERLGGQDRGAVAKKELCALGDSKQTTTSMKACGHTSSITDPSTTCPPPLFRSSAPPHTAATSESRMGIDCTSPTYHYGDDGQVKGPMEVELHRNNSPSPYQRETDADRPEVNPRLSFRQIFSMVGRSGAGKVLSRVRSNSLDQLNVPISGAPGPGSSKPSGPGQLRKTPSLQTLNMGSPFLKLRKPSSLQSDRSTVRSPGLSRGLQRALSVEDVGGPSAVRSVGRVVQACSDGTFLLDLHKPPSGSYGFLISRGKGRPDSGVYVEEMIDSSTEKLYAGLLAIGDEILEVNGEKVVGLSLDRVTHRLTNNNSANIRVLRHRKPPQR